MRNNPIALFDVTGLHWEYSQSHHTLVWVDDKTGRRTPVSDKGYSGKGEGLNNPDMQHVRNTGPIPRGEWTIDPKENRPHGTGPASLPLTPRPGTDTHSRTDFLIHGDNAKHNYTASEGCISLPRDVRDRIAASGDPNLRVVR